MSEQTEKSKAVLKVHFVYIVVIAIIIIAALVTLLLFQQEQAGRLLGFAATITSIVLSIIAIFMTVLSNDSMTNLIHRIHSITEKINPLSQKVKESETESSKLIENLEILNNQINAFENHLTGISTSVAEYKDMTHEELDKHHQSIKSIENMLPQNSKQPESLNTEEWSFNMFLTRTSYRELYFIYLLKELYVHEISLDFYNESLNKYYSSDYMRAFLLCFYSSGYISLGVKVHQCPNNGMRLNFTISDLKSEIQTYDIRKECIEKVKQLVDVPSEDQPQHFFFTVDNYISIQGKEEERWDKESEENVNKQTTF